MQNKFIHPLGVPPYEFARKSGLKIFPNPSLGTITVETPEKGQLILFNLTGQQILNLMITGPTTSINLSHLPGGVYLVKITSENKIQVAKVMKE